MVAVILQDYWRVEKVLYNLTTEKEMLRKSVEHMITARSKEKIVYSKKVIRMLSSA